MSESSRKTSGRRAKKKQAAKQLDAMDVSDTEPPNEPFDDLDSAEKVEDVPEMLSDMTEEEMAQHLKLCMKLSAENKINSKNAFGLHLINIMEKLVRKSETTDIQQASLSLQASSKIYAGRVEALYQDTSRFHGQLQSIVSGGKKEKKIRSMEDDMMDMDDNDDAFSEKGKGKPQKNKCKSFLKSEESLSIDPEASAGSVGDPHGNFVTINSAFSTSRLAPKLLSCMQLVNDSCILKCAVPEPCFKPRNVLTDSSFSVPPKFKGFMEKLKSLRSEDQALSSECGFPFTPYANSSKPGSTSGPSTPVASSPNHNTSFCNDDMQFRTPEHDVMLPPADVLNITADALVRDISAAVTSRGLDHTLLPPDSVLKRMLDKSRRSSIKPPIGKSTKKKAKEPFFAGKSADSIKHLFVKGRALALSQKSLSEWTVENTSSIDLGYDFIEELENRGEKNEEFDFKRRMEFDQVLEIIKQNDLQYQFKYYFNKQSQMWKVLRRKLCLNQSSLNASYANQTEKRVGSIAPNEAEVLALSLQNLSLNESAHENPCTEANESGCDAPQFDESEDENFLVPSESFEMDIENMMVKPPDLVRPASMKYDTQPSNLNIEKIKNLLWKIITKRLKLNDTEGNNVRHTLFSEVYEDLKYRLERETSEFISVQFAFVALLILTNEKTLLIENVEKDGDLAITQDISEIDVSENI